MRAVYALCGVAAGGVTRMATLAEAGRINDEVVAGELARLQRQWRPHDEPAEFDLETVMPAQAIAALDLFDAMQLRGVVQVCRSSKSLSDAGRKLYAVSRETKARANDADRLKKYLARFELEWDSISN